MNQDIRSRDIPASLALASFLSRVMASFSEALDASPSSLAFVEHTQGSLVKLQAMGNPGYCDLNCRGKSSGPPSQGRECCRACLTLGHDNRFPEVNPRSVFLRICDARQTPLLGRRIFSSISERYPAVLRWYDSAEHSRAICGQASATRTVNGMMNRVAFQSSC